MPSSRSKIAIISPASAEANNGNWRTASRWQRMLKSRHAVSVDNDWTPDDTAPDVMIALHAQRSGDAIARFADAQPTRPLVVVMTGTDLYGEQDATVRRSLAAASRIVVLHDDAASALPASMRARCETILQSAPKLARRTPDPRTFDLVMVAHMREVKDPETAWRAFERVAQWDRAMRLVHVGDALEPRYAEAATALAARHPGFRWLGPLSHALTRQQIRRARALVIPSRSEGGANVIVEAIVSGLPVLASAIPGNIGLLGRGYAGTFPVGDDVALARLIERIRDNRDFLKLLTQQCAERAPLFRPEQERARLIRLVDSCLATTAPSSSTPPSS